MRHIAPYLSLFHDTAKYFLAGRKEPLTILEIGVARGTSTEFFLRGLQARHDKGDWGEGVLYSMDIENCERNVRDTTGRWTFIQTNSTTADWDKPIDVLFIDGDHTYEGAKADFDKYSPFVRPGGVIYMHDILHPRYGVNKIWNEITFPKVALPFNPAGLGIVNIPKK